MAGCDGGEDDLVAEFVGCGYGGVGGGDACDDGGGGEDDAAGCVCHGEDDGGDGG